MASIADVARAARVSSSTVSYVLSGKRPISAETRARVQEAIRALGYHPHAGARALASARTQVIGLLAPLRPGVDVGIVMQFVAGVVTTARTFDHDILLLTSDDTDGPERASAASLVDALIMMDVAADDPRLPALAGFLRPVVLIGVPGEDPKVSCVDLDFAGAARLAVRHLAELGHRRIGLIGSPPAVAERRTGFAERVRDGFLAEGGSTVVQQAMINTETDYAAAQQVVHRLSRLPDPPTAVLIHNEAALPPLLAAWRRYGIEIGRDLSVVAICPDPVATTQEVPVTNVDIPAGEIGAIAVRMVMARLNAPQPAEVRLLPPILTRRESSGPAPDSNPTAADQATAACR